MAERWRYFWYLFVEGLGIVAVPPFGAAAIFLSGGLVASLIGQRPFGTGRWRNHYWLILTQLLFYPAAIAVGVLYAVGPRRPFDPLPKVNPLAEMMLNAIAFLSLALGSYWVYRLKGLRWVAFCFLALQLLFLYGALFLSGMSISGDWI